MFTYASKLQASLRRKIVRYEKKWCVSVYECAHLPRSLRIMAFEKYKLLKKELEGLESV